MSSLPYGRNRIVTCIVLLCLFLLSACRFEDTITPIVWEGGEAESVPAEEIEPLPDDDSSEPPALPPEEEENEVELTEREATIQEAIDEGDYQQAIELTVDLYDLDTSDAPGMPQYSTDVPPNTYAVTDPGDGSVLVGPASFSSPATLATTLGHELVHTQQIAEGRAYLVEDENGDAQVISEQGIFLNELEAWKWELEHADENELPDEELELIQAGIDHYYTLLTDENKDLADNEVFVLPEVEPEEA